MIGPGGGVAATHFKSIHDHGEDSAGRVTPYVVKKVECADVQQSLNRKFSQEKVYGRYW